MIFHNDQFFITTSNDHQIKIWNLKTFEIYYIFHDQNIIFCCDITQKDDFLLTGSRNLKLWDLQKLQLSGQFGGTDRRGPIRSCKFLRNDQFIITLCAENYVKCWKTFSAESIYIVKINGFSVRCLSISKNDWVVLGGTNGKIQILNLMNGEEKYRVKVSQQEVTCISFLNDDSIFCFGGLDGKLQFYNLETKTFLKNNLIHRYRGFKTCSVC